MKPRKQYPVKLPFYPVYTMLLCLSVMKLNCMGCPVSSAVIAGTLEMDSLYAFAVLSVLSANNDSMLCGLPQAVLLTHQVECY